MNGPALPPTPPTTLVVLLGASEWPSSPAFASSKAFSNAAKRFTAYLLHPQFFGLPSENLLNLFDSSANASEQLEQMSLFLERRTMAMKALQQVVRDVVIYFIGHGGFVGHDSDFYLMHRRTTVDRLRASGISIAALADIVLDKARHARRYVFLDCCFAAAAFKSFQGGPDQVALTKTLDAFYTPTKGTGFPRKGTVLLCSSDQKTPSLLLPDESSTMFSQALLEALMQGDAQRSEYLSLRDVKELTLDWLSALPSQNAPRPALLSPDQSEGDVADIPFFPNPRAQEELRRRTEEERRHQAEKQARKEEEERRRAQEERVRRAEEDRLRRARESFPNFPPPFPVETKPAQLIKTQEVLDNIQRGTIPPTWQVFRPNTVHYFNRSSLLVGFICIILLMIILSSTINSLVLNVGLSPIFSGLSLLGSFAGLTVEGLIYIALLWVSYKRRLLVLMPGGFIQRSGLWGLDTINYAEVANIRTSSSWLEERFWGKDALFIEKANRPGEHRSMGVRIHPGYEVRSEEIASRITSAYRQFIHYSSGK